MVIPGNQSYYDITITNKDRIEAIAMKAVFMFAEHPNVVYPHIEVPGIESGFLAQYIPPGGMVLLPDSQAYLRIRFSCKSFSRSKVFLSIPFQ